MALISSGSSESYPKGKTHTANHLSARRVILNKTLLEQEHESRGLLTAQLLARGPAGRLRLRSDRFQRGRARQTTRARAPFVFSVATSIDVPRNISTRFANFSHWYLELRRLMFRTMPKSPLPGRPSRAQYPLNRAIWRSHCGKALRNKVVFN